MNRKAKNGIKVLTCLVIATAFMISGLTAVLADDTVPVADEVTSYERLLPPGEHPPVGEPPETMDWSPTWSPETFDTDFGAFTTLDMGNANDFEWTDTQDHTGNGGGCVYHAGMSPYDATTVEDYLISAGVPTQFFGAYTVEFFYQGSGTVDLYYTWADPMEGWDPTSWYFLGTYGGQGAGWTKGSETIPTGNDECNIFYIIFNAYGNDVGEDIYIDDIWINYTFEGMDIDVTALVKPDPNIGHPVAPPEVWVEVTNAGTEIPIDPATGDPKIDLHLQIYEEVDYQPEIDNLNDFEGCCSEWPFYAMDWDGDGMTWTLTERRSHSPTHSWRCTPCDRATYAGNSHDSLISYPKKIPEWENHVWLNFSCWVQGEITPEMGKFEDYLEVWIRIDNDSDGNWDYVSADNPEGWILLKKIADTGEEWLYVEQLEDGTQALDFTNGNQDHWLCKKGSGAPEKWWGGIDLTDGYGWAPGFGIVPLNVSANDQIQLNFTWKSDPCHQFEGAYIDDVCILSLRGQEQPLVYNEYKILHYALQPGETIMVKFPLVEQYWTPKEDTWYFFEVYSNVPGDVDGLADNNYTVKYTEKVIPDPYYRDPWNGVNETIYFGHYIDAAVTNVAVDKEFELYMEQCAETECTDVPIEITVFNNGTYAEDVPVILEIRKKLAVTLFEDDFETGTIDNWQGHISADHQGDLLGLVTDWMPASGNYHMAIADERIMYHNHHGGGPFTVDVLPIPEGDSPIWFDFKAMWAVENEGHPSFELDPSTPIYYKDYDAWAPGILDPVAGAFLFWWPTTNPLVPAAAPTGPPVWTGHSNYQYVNYEKFFDLRPVIEHYQALGYLTGGMEIGFYFRADDADCYEDELPLDTGACLQTDCAPFGGVLIDDVKIYYEAPGDLVYTDTQTVHLEPKESKTVKFTWEACTYCDFFVVGKVALEGDCNAGNDEAQNETYLYHEIFYDDIETETPFWSTEDNTYVEGGDWSICTDDRCVYENHVWTVVTEDLQYANPADEILQMVNPETEDGSFDLTDVDDAVIEFDLWNEIESGWDHLLLEVSNDSGQNWWTIDSWSKTTNVLENEEKWEHISIELFNKSKGIDYIQAWDGHSKTAFSWASYSLCWDYWLGVIDIFQGEDTYWDMYKIWDAARSLGVDPMSFWPAAPDYGETAPEYYLRYGSTHVGITDEMHFRFHMLSDSNTAYKGAYIDNVYLNTSENKTIVMDGGHYDKPWEWVNTVIFHDDMEDAEASAEKWLTLDGNPVVHGRALSGCPTGDKWHRSNHSSLSGDYSWYCADMDPWSSYGTYINGGWLTSAPASLFGDPIKDPYGLVEAMAFPPGWYGINETTWMNAVFGMVDTNGDGAPDTWAGDLYGRGSPWIPGDPNPLIYWVTEHYHNYSHYRNNMDNKLILTLDLTDKWKGYLTYDLHYNFSDAGDYLVVEISNDGGTTWKELARYTNDTNTNCEWVHENGQPATEERPRGYHGIKITPWLPGQIMIRWRMISDESGTDVGVELDNVRITGAPDCEAPTTTCILNPPTPDGNNGWYVSPVEITLVAVDDREVAATYYSIDGGAWLEYTAPITISADGEHTVSYYSVDTVGNAEEVKSCPSFKIDMTSPTASLTFPQAGYIYLFGRELMPRIFDKSKALIIGGLTATATASDAMSGVAYVRFTTGAGTGEDAVSPYEFNLPFYFPFGTDTLSVSVTDLAGNSATDGSVDYIKIL